MTTEEKAEETASTEEAKMEEKARAEAQARKERILAGGEDRLDLDKTTTAADETAKSSRIAAMRRRRFKKKEKTDPEKTTTDESTEDTPATKEESTEPATKAIESTTKGDDKMDDEIVEEINTPGVQKEDKKKYMGVAKMRRKMIQEKKQQQASTPATTRVPATKTSKKTTVQMKADRVAIIMHVIVVLLLFLAGLDVGLQGKLDYGSQVVVQTGMAPQDMKFLDMIPGVDSIPFLFREKAVPNEEEEIVVKVVQQEKIQPPTEEDEFCEEKPHAVQEENIDPLFGVDLDELTAGPGLYKTLARGAISLHRVNLAMFFYGPRSVWKKLNQTFTTFLVVPPLLGLIALALRQVLGKILGAHLPELVVDEAQHHDIVSTVVTFVKNFLSGSFPRVISMYKGWVLLRGDMYVVVCGLLVGMAWQHSQLVPSETVPGGRDEL
jgi:hypothetical protein